MRTIQLKLDFIGCTAHNGKKLRKRRELNAMAAPHVIIRGGHSTRSRKSDQSIYFSNSSSNDDLNDEDDGLFTFVVKHNLYFTILETE